MTIINGLKMNNKLSILLCWLIIGSVTFIPAIKINFYVKIFKKFFLGRKIFIARELTKIHETFYRENLDRFTGFKIKLKGELTVIISGKVFSSPEKNLVDEMNLKKEISKLLKRYTVRDIVNLVSRKNNLSKKKVYNLCLSIKK